jgi:dTDP-4-dehydrorhamnose reductase
MKNEGELLIVGAGGMLGTALTLVGAHRGHTTRAYARADLDITDHAAVRAEVAGFAKLVARGGGRGAVLNAAAYNDVEKAEEEAERAYLVNEHAAGWLAGAARDQGLAFVHVSTDFVFDGMKTGSYVESDEPHPINVYGASKRAGEQAVFSSHPAPLIVRTAWSYGLGGASFPTKIIQRARAATSGAVAASTAATTGTEVSAPALRAVSDEFGSPTYTIDLASGLLALLSMGATGLYHLAGTGSCSRYELALETLRLAGFAVPGDLTVEPVMAADFPTKATRPANSVLDCGKAARLGVRLPPWQDGLARFVAEL